MASRRSDSESTASFPAIVALSMAEPYDAMASAVRPARSCSRPARSERAACPSTGGVNDGTFVVISASPGDCIVGEVNDLPGHCLRRAIGDRGQIIEQVQEVVDVGNLRWHQAANDAAVGVAHR